MKQAIMKKVKTIAALWMISGPIVVKRAQAYHQSFSGKENLTELSYLLTNPRVMDAGQEKYMFTERDHKQVHRIGKKKAHYLLQSATIRITQTPLFSFQKTEHTAKPII